MSSGEFSQKAVIFFHSCPIIQMFKGYRMMEKLFLAMVYSEYPWLEAAPLLLVEHRQFENPEKKHTEHWIEMAPSDFRSKVADWSDTIMSSPAADGVVTLINTR